MALKSYGQQLEEVQLAIEAVQSNQEYKMEKRTLRRADLQWLHEREKWLTDKLDSVGDIIPGQTTTRRVLNVGFKQSQ